MQFVSVPIAAQIIAGLPASPFRSLMQQGWDYEQAGHLRAAAGAYRAALQTIPPWLSQSARPLLDHAKACADKNDAEMGDFLEAQLAQARGRHEGADLRRFDRTMDTLLRRRRVFRPQPSFMYFPELPAIEFHDRAAFPWLDRLEAATDDIRQEFLGLQKTEVLEPYVSGEGALPQWRELHNSPRWGVFYLWKAGEPQADTLARCPKTAEALSGWPQCELLGTGPTAVFSVLDARTRIPAHVGVNNARLIVHLPLIVPPGCGFRVGAETRGWEPGRAFVFDDTIEHEAWNESDEPRAVLILDIWNPALTPAERDLITALTAGVGAWYGELPSFAREG